VGAGREISVVARPTAVQIAALVRSQLSISTRATAVFGLMGAPVLYAFFLLSGSTAPFPQLAVVCVIGIAYSLFLLVYVPWKAARSPSARELLEHGSRYRFTAEAVIVEGIHGTADLRWSAFERARRIRDFYALRLSTLTAWHIIPVASFASPQEEAEFRERVREKLGPAARL